MNDLFFRDLESTKLDAQQWNAYRSMENTVVIAGPGSGKTRILTLKAISLIQSQIYKPSGLACISFSRETVRELKKRFRLYGYKSNPNDFIGTVHSFSLMHVIKPFAHLFPEYGVKYPIKLLPKEIEEEMYLGVLNEMNIETKMVSLTEISKERSLSIEGLSAVKIPSSDLVKNAAAKFEHRLLNTGYLDFTGIINTAALIIRDQEFVRRTLQSRFPWLLIDEYQDLGKALHEMVLELVFKADIKLYAVGDMNQSIYGFNGGYPDFLQELTNYADITPYYLTGNYRSNQHIIDASMAALEMKPPVPEYAAQLRTNESPDFTFITCEEEIDEQFDLVSKKVIPKLRNAGISLNEIGVIVSSNNQVKALSEMLALEKIPFYIAKWSFENTAVVQWLQDCASWCIGDTDTSFDEIFNFWLRLLDDHDHPQKHYEKIRLKINFLATLRKCKIEKILASWLNLILSELDLKNLLRDSEVYLDEAQNIEKLVEEATLHNLKGTRIERFARLGVPENEVTITTRHSAKGLEFEAVILLGMEEGKFPYYKNIQDPILLAEDQRLCYVCVSRAKRICILLRSKKYTTSTKWGLKEHHYSASRFWMALFEKYGNRQNDFDSVTFNK